MDSKDIIYITLAVLTILSFFYDRVKGVKEDNGLIIRLTTTLENLSSQVTKLNTSIDALNAKTNEFNREVGVLDNKVMMLNDHIEKLSHKVEELERYIYGGNTHD